MPRPNQDPALRDDFDHGSEPTGDPGSGGAAEVRADAGGDSGGESGGGSSGDSERRSGRGADCESGGGAAAGPDLAARLGSGDAAAQDEFFSRVYTELHRIAQSYMAHQGGAHTLQPTALVNEVYLKLAGKGSNVDDEAHFLNLAARAMRQVLVDHARRRNAGRRRPDGDRVPLDALVDAYEEHTGDLLELEELLAALEEIDPELVRIVELRFYAGRTTREIADVLGRSVRDVERRWEMTRRIVRRELDR